MSGISISCVIEPSSLPDNLICSICHDLAQCPISTTCCYQVFCHGCMAKVKSSGSSACPVDRKPLPSVLPLLKTSNPLAYRIWNGIKLRCPCAVSGCEWTGSGETFESHQRECRSKTSKGDVTSLKDEIDCLRLENKKILSEKQLIVEENIRLTHDLVRVRDDLHDLRQMERSRVRLGKMVELDSSYRYDRFRTIELTKLVLQDLEDIPGNIAAHRIYQCVENIKRDYFQNYQDNPDHFFLDLRALLATCLASTWFSLNQQARMKEWWNSLVRTC